MVAAIAVSLVTVLIRNRYSFIAGQKECFPRQPPPSIDGNTKAIKLALNDITVSNNLGIELGNKRGAGSGQRCCTRKHQGPTGGDEF